MKPTLGIIGAGKVGRTLARLLYAQGYTVAAVYSPTHAHDLAREVGSTVTDNPRDVLHHAQLVLLTVPDDVIEPLAVQLAVDDLAGKAVIHTSGVHGAQSLARLAVHGAMTGSLHPVYPFASVETVLHGLDGVTFALEAESAKLASWLSAIVQALGGQVLVVPPGSKGLYHAALVLASNYTVTLYALAEQLLLAISDDRKAVDGALNALVSATVDNLREVGIPAALTGPLVRGDVQTIKAHLQALNDADSETAALYRQLGLLTLPLVKARGTAPEALEQVLRRNIEDATDNP